MHIEKTILLKLKVKKKGKYSLLVLLAHKDMDTHTGEEPYKYNKCNNFSHEIVIL